ncbi:serine/threonine-protein kinase [Quadrisphaera oryzae]|uniref:serine/threonine-protein kinase n=1 Tax=Quadrisphaera TaxID=317661 RepID=UPI00164676A0|nr:serine/threonine-protein kinase [Quadrisphaera sp. RL12-1S]MBC3763895.1 serine/threonine protein kinase [Quadrisphaera sp. RL12-1S]
MRVDAGTVLGNRYQLTTPIASGGMGEVWEAHDELLGRTVAVKVLRSELASDAGFLARFRTEARNSARLAHPAIAATYDYGESDGSAWLVMELVPGEPLSDLLATQHSVEPRRAMRIIASAASGLAAAHEAGIVHRDVKPGNLLVTPTGGVKVTDFGIARAAAEAPLTATGQVMGTAAYLSPEQATGRRDLTPAVDVYALGVVAHEMLAGQRPFTGESQVAIALAQVNDPPPPLPSSVPAGARALVDACLAKDPNARPRDAAVVAQVASLVADGDDARAQRVLLAGLGSAAAAAAGAAGASTVALPPTADATRAMPPQDDETVPWPEPAAPATRRSAQAAAAAYAAGAGIGAGAGAAHGGAYPRTGMTTGPQGTPEPTGQRSGRGRMTVPLLGLLAVLVLVLAALVYFNGQRSTSNTPQNAPLSTVSPSTSTSPSPERTTVTQTQTETATSSAASQTPSTATSAPSESASQSASAPASTASEPASSAPAVTPSAGTSATPGASGTAGGVGAAGAAVQGVGGA